MALRAGGANGVIIQYYALMLLRTVGIAAATLEFSGNPIAFVHYDGKSGDTRAIGAKGLGGN